MKPFWHLLSPSLITSHLTRYQLLFWTFRISDTATIYSICAKFHRICYSIPFYSSVVLENLEAIVKEDMMNSLSKLVNFFLSLFSYKELSTEVTIKQEARCVY